MSSKKKSTHEANVSEVMRMNQELLERCDRLEKELSFERELKVRRETADPLSIINKANDYIYRSTIRPLRHTRHTVQVKPPLSAQTPNIAYFEDRTGETLEKINTLHNIVNDLFERLDPVLRPVAGEEGRPPNNANPADSKLNEFFQTIENRIESLCEKLTGAMSRLTI